MLGILQSLGILLVVVAITRQSRIFVAGVDFSYQHRYNDQRSMGGDETSRCLESPLRALDSDHGQLPL